MSHPREEAEQVDELQLCIQRLSKVGFPAPLRNQAEVLSEAVAADDMGGEQTQRRGDVNHWPGIADFRLHSTAPDLVHRLVAFPASSGVDVVDEMAVVQWTWSGLMRTSGPCPVEEHC